MESFVFIEHCRFNIGFQIMEQKMVKYEWQMEEKDQRKRCFGCEQEEKGIWNFVHTFFLGKRNTVDVTQMAMMGKDFELIQYIRVGG